MTPVHETRKGRHRHNGGGAGGGCCIRKVGDAVPFDDNDDDMLSTALERRLSPWRYISDRKAEELQHARARDGTELFSGHVLVRRSTTSCCRTVGRRTKEIGRLPTLAALRNNGWRGSFRGTGLLLDPAELGMVRSSAAAPPTHARIRREPEPEQPVCAVHYLPVTSPRRQPR
jgi:hypothetical protein